MKEGGGERENNIREKRKEMNEGGRKRENKTKEKRREMKEGEGERGRIKQGRRGGR